MNAQYHRENLLTALTKASEAMGDNPEGLRHLADLKRLIGAPPEVPVLPELNADLINILGRPNFTCIRLAQLLRLSGVDIATKAENEQATVIHYLLGFYLKHGAQWAEKADEDLEQRRLAVVATQQGKGGAA